MLRDSLRGSAKGVGRASVCLIALLTFATVVVFTIIAFNPIVVLAIAETDSGQRDFVLKPKAAFLNATKVAELSSFRPMPRIVTDFVLNQSKAAKGVLMDFVLEEQLGLGALGLQLPSFTDPSTQAYVYSHQSLGFAKGSNLSIAFASNQILETILDIVNNQSQTIEGQTEVTNAIKAFIDSNKTLSAVFTVKQVLSSAMGKMGPSSVEGAFFFDIKHAFAVMLNQSFPHFGPSKLLSLLRSFRLSDVATEATVNFPNRIGVYSNANTEEVISLIRRFGQSIVQQIGFFAVDVEMPILSQLQTLQNFGMFVALTLKSVIVSLFVLSTLMLHNAVLLAVEEQRCDLSVLKLLGADRSFVASKILRSSLRTVTVANLIAYPFVFVAFRSIEALLKQSVGYTVSVGFTPQSLFMGVLVGLLVPVCASILPIANILSNDLANDLSHRPKHLSETKTEVYVEGAEFPWKKVAFGVLSTVYGLSVYFLLPYGLINESFGLLAVLFFVVLEGLLVGLVLLTNAFDSVLQAFLARLLLCCADASDRRLTLKNLSMHRAQNRQTSMVYALSVALVIMLSVGFHLQVSTVQQQFLNSMGAHIDIGGLYINPDFMSEVLSQVVSLQMYTFTTLPLGQFLAGKGVNKVLLSDKARLFFIENSIYGVGGSLISKTPAGTLVFAEDYEANIYDYINTQRGQDSCIISEYAANKMGILQTNLHQFYINIYYAHQLQRVPINYTAVSRKRLGLYFNPFPFPPSEVAVSLQTYKRLANLGSNEELPIIRTKIYLGDLSQIEQVASAIRYQIQINKKYPQNITYIWTRTATDQTFSNIRHVLTFIMAALLIIVLILSLFSLITTTHINIQKQQRQIGILLSLGFQRSRIQRIFIYQSFVVIILSCTKGMACGYIVALMMYLQNDLFTNTQATPSIQLTTLLTIVLLATVSSFITAKKTLSSLWKKQASQMINAFH